MSLASACRQLSQQGVSDHEETPMGLCFGRLVLRYRVRMPRNRFNQQAKFSISWHA